MLVVDEHSLLIAIVVRFMISRLPMYDEGSRDEK